MTAITLIASALALGAVLSAGNAALGADPGSAAATAEAMAGASPSEVAPGNQRAGTQSARAPRIPHDDQDQPVWDIAPAPPPPTAAPVTPAPRATTAPTLAPAITTAAPTPRPAKPVPGVKLPGLRSLPTPPAPPTPLPSPVAGAPAPVLTPPTSPIYTHAQMIAIVTAASTNAGVDPQWVLRIGTCESGLSPYSTGRGAAVGHYGAFQFLISTFATNARTYLPRGTVPNIWDPVQQAMVATSMLAHGQAWQWTCASVVPPPSPSPSPG
jgi:hypothetical protein